MNSMLESKELLQIFGNPFTGREDFIAKHMILWDIPSDINSRIPALPNRLYTNKRMVVPLEKVFRELMAKNLYQEIISYDGCFNIRKTRSGKGYSKHSWGIAIDLNAHENPFVKVPVGKLDEYKTKFVKWSNDFLDVWRKDFVCGADWFTVLDGMHFELKSLA